ncbi:2-oxoglutarate dehydrogenase E1 component [Lentibacillus halophilus]|uniref:2-oxoglutarate dehydrogenase E1 component n=1 Tax=Lentibacillus halophilus TaxID=295065 RepID=A0ABN0Z984_9BACI
MTHNGESHEGFWESFHGPNMGYIEEQYELYRENPDAVDSSLKELFDEHGAPDWVSKSKETAQPESQSTATPWDVKKLTSAMKLVEAIRRFGHMESDIYPVGRDERQTNLVNPETYGLTEADLREIPASWLWEQAPSGVQDGFEVIERLKTLYSGTITFEYDHVNQDDERAWLLNYIETARYNEGFSDKTKKGLLRRLAEVEGFEEFLQKTFVGQKRFSIEGLASMVPILDRIVKNSNEDNIEHIMMGMAHRGRLSVLAHILGKPFDKIFSEFHHSPDKELIPSEGSIGINYGWTGDVKYHLGATKDVKADDQTSGTRITLANNPSHLEFVNPVVEGLARAGQDTRSQSGYPGQDFNSALPVLIHGDASFIGEGVVAETLNFKGLSGYQTGGTLHIIANNLLGYTTNQQDGRSTRYASDLAKGFEIPIIHVNADDPVACVSAAMIAYEYRQTFHKDFLIDLVGYRRYGHNEMDEPRATQPKLYKHIDNHPTTSSAFAEKLQQEGIIGQNDLNTIQDEVMAGLRDVYENMKENDAAETESKKMPSVLSNGLDRFKTAIPLDKLEMLNKQMQKRPDGFTVFRKLERILKRRENVLEEGNKADWGTGEALTYASILYDGTPIRLTGQDTERGTFAHRHMVLHDAETGEKYSPLHGIEGSEASFDIRNSPLSEAGVLGFEYGYSVQSPETLVIWEAQFGDFANAAQVIFDQFISAARAKWGDKSNLVMLLPHGYEGQGPEHSSARLERFLQLAAENNLIVANVTSSAQFFHLIRRQAAMRGQEEARPLVLMTPKSLLRNQRVASEAKEFTEGKFEPLRRQPNLHVNNQDVKRLVIGSGKVMVDIEEEMANSDETFDWLDVLRVEQIYPFPVEKLEKELQGLPNLEEIVWVQEEPQNMGSWDFVDDYLRDLLQEGQILRYAGRPQRASPAVGEPNADKAEQRQIIQDVITPSKGGDSSERN